MASKLVERTKGYDVAISAALQERRYGAAAELLKDGLNESSQAGRIDSRLISVANKLAEDFQLHAEYTRAASLYRSVMLAREKALGRNHPDVLDSLASLQSVSVETGWLKPS